MKGGAFMEGAVSKYSKWGLAVGLVVAVLLGVPACKRDAHGQRPAVSGETVKAEKPAAKAFGVVSAFPDQKGDQPLSIAVEFSQALVSIQDFDAQLAVTENGAPVKGSWVLDDDARTLRFPHVQPSHTYKVLAKAGISAAGGDKLKQAVEKVVYTGPLDPAVGFASQGSVLPARESRGLPVISVNVPEVDVEFLRVREKDLPRFLAQYQRGGRRGSWELDNRYNSNPRLPDMADPVYLNRFVLDGKRNERSVTYLPVQDITELQEPGLYFALLKRSGSFPDQFDTAFFSVSDLGVHARAYKDKMFVHVASLHDGAAVGNVELRVLDAKGEAVLKGETDANGNALLPYKLDATQVLVARKGRDVSLLGFNQPALDLSEFSVAGREQAWFDVFAWSGRDLYRPGETVRISALLRDQDGQPLAAKSKKLQPVFVRYVQPDGSTLLQTRLQPDAQGYVRHEQVIPAEAATGRWRVEFRTDPGSKEAVQGMTLRIEEFLPERLKLDLAAQPLLRPAEPIHLAVDAAYLYGAPASGNRFTAKLAVAVEQHPLEQLPGWFFGDPTLALPKQAADVIDTTLDAEGKLRKDIPLPAEARPTSPIAAIVAGSLYESGGRSVNRTLKKVLWPADALVGIRPAFDPVEGADANSNPGFELTRVGSDGQPRPAKGLKITLVREHRDYHWAFEDDSWDYDFTSRFEAGDSRTVDIGATPTRLTFPVEWGSYRVEVYDPATKLTTRFPFVAGWGWDDDNRGLDARPDKVKVSLDKTAYRAGDTLKVTLTPPHPGKGLLLVESDKLLYVHDIDVKAGSTFEIPVTQEWERHDVYVTALVFRGGSAPSKITPARAVGEAWVPMDRRERTVAVGLKVPARMEPEKPLPVAVSVPQLAGQDAFVTVSAVDVGILNITRFPVPDASAHFFAQRRLGVDAYDVYGRVIESFEGGIARLRFGGDMGLEALPQARRPTARVQTVDLFAGPVKLDAKGNARVDLAVPDFNGSLRVSALVYSGGRYGKRDQEVLVRAPLLAEASVPRVLAPGDRSNVTLDLQNFSGRAGTFKVNVEGIGPLTLGEGSRTVQLGVDQKVTLVFPATARSGNEVAQVRIRAQGNGHSVDRRYDLPVRPGWPQVLRSRTQVVSEAGTVTLPVALSEGLMPDSVTARISVGALPPIPFAAALKGALEYPYGCAEQTTSRSFAALALDASTATMLGTKALSDAERKRYVEAAFGRLAGLQISSGHYSMWGDGDYVNPLITPYVVEFLLESRKGGFGVPDALLQKSLKVMNDDLLTGGPPFFGQDRRDQLKFAYQAYAGYALARVNRAPLGTLRALYDNERKKAGSGLPLVQLGVALSLQGDKARGARAIADGFAMPPREATYYLADYGSRVRDEALMLALLHENGLDSTAYDARVQGLALEVEARRRTGWLWLSTQEQIALVRLGKALGLAQGKQVSGRWTVAGQSFEAPAARTLSREVDAATLAKGVSVAVEGQPPFYASFDVAGVPLKAPAPDASQLQVTRDYYNTDGTAWNGGKLAEGDALIVKVTITPKQDMPDALLTELLPAGLELENFNLGDAKQWADVSIDGIELSDRSEAAQVRHEEFRDDRYVAALQLSSGQAARVFYLVRAVTPGSYTVPPPLVEDMYRPDVRGVGKSSPAALVVTQPGQ